MKYLLIISILFLAGCANKLKEGYVIEKWHEPRTEYMMLMPMVISDGKSVTTIYTPYWIVDNEDWVVKIRGKYKGKVIEESVYVGEKQYECLSVSSHLKINEDCSTDDLNNTKTAQ